MDPHPRRACYHRWKRVQVERDDSTKNRKHEWVPLQRGKEIAVKELDATSRHPARDAWKPGKVMKDASRPWQPDP